LKEAATTEVAQAVSRENYMLDLMAAASLEIAGMFYDSRSSLAHRYLFILSSHVFRIGSFMDTDAEDRRADARSTVLVNLALDNNSSFWSSPDRTRQIADFKIARVKFKNISRSVPRL
jgi:hypothetical protein